MNDEHPSDEDRDWYARERARSEGDRSRARTASLIRIHATATSAESDDAYMAQVKKREERRVQDAKNHRRDVDEMTGLIRRLKASSDPGNERDLIAQIKRLDHPFLDDLIRTCAERVAGSRSTRARKDHGL